VYNGQYLLNTNESATVSIFQKILEPNKALIVVATDAGLLFKKIAEVVQINYLEGSTPQENIQSLFGSPLLKFSQLKLF
jgi:hypothetical protein